VLEQPGRGFAQRGELEERGDVGDASAAPPPTIARPTSVQAIAGTIE
jgi:hypothetical protein